MCLIAIPKAHKVQKGQDGAGSTKASVARYLEEYDEQLSKNELKNTFVARLLASYNRDSVCPEYDSEWNIPCGAEFQAHLGVYLQPKGGVYKVKRGLVRSLVRSLKYSLVTTHTLGEFERSVQVEVDRRSLNLLLAVITTPETVLKDEDAAASNSNAIRSVLNEEGVTVSCVRMMQAKNEETVDTSLRLLIALLEGGFRECQDTLLAEFKNNVEDQFFKIVRAQVQEAVISIKEYRVLTSMKEARHREERELLLNTRQETRRRTTQNTVGKGNHSGEGDGSAKEKEPGAIEMGDLHSASQAMDTSASPLTTSPAARRQSLLPGIFQTADKAAEGKKDPADALGDDDLVDLESLPFSELTGVVKQVIRVLQLLCENHNLELRNFLREQPGSVKSFNCVKEVAEFLSVVATHVNKDSISLVTQVLNSLNEFVMGNLTNQAVLVNAKVLDIVNLLLRQREKDYAGCESRDVADMKLKIVIFVKSLVEDNTSESLAMVRQILAIMDLEAIFETMITYGTNDRIDDTYTYLDIRVACGIIFAVLKDLMGEGESDDDRLELFLFSGDSGKLDELLNKYEDRGYTHLTDMLQSLAKCTECIEIVVHDNLQRIYFRSQDRVLMNQKFRDELLYSMDRGESQSERIRDFMARGAVMQDKMRYLRRVEGNFLSRLIIHNSQLLYVLIMLLTLAINIIMLAAWSGDTNNADNSTPFVSGWYWPTLYTLGGCHIFLSVLVVIDHFLRDPPVVFGDVTFFFLFSLLCFF